MGADLVTDTSVALSTETDAAARSEPLDALTSTPRFQKVAPHSVDRQRLRENPEVQLGDIHTSGKDGQLRRSDNKAEFDQECAIYQLFGS